MNVRNVSSEGSQRSCRGLTISYVPLNAKRLIRNDGSGRLLRNCAVMAFGGRM
jgi:hypothetical protein